MYALAMYVSIRILNTFNNIMNILCMYIDDCDCNNNAILIGVVAGVDCVVIIIVVITNIIVWIYCFRKKHHTGMYMPIIIRIISCR